MTDLDKESIEEILTLLQEHNEKIEAIEAKLDDIKETVDLFYQIFKYISNFKLKSELQISQIRENILVVDDDPGVVDTFKTILDGVGFTVDTASNALEAIRKASRLHFDLIIIDMNLPDTLGDELANRLHSINSDLKILMITGYSNYKEQLEKNQEVIDVLMKPINPEDLILATKRMLHEK